MKILIANKFYYRRGGDCIYAMNLEKLLKSHGHEVAVFAMQHPDNLSTPWSKYFPSEVAFRPGKGLLKAIFRPFGTQEVRTCFNKIMDDFHPDIVHLNNIHSQLSPVIGQIAHERGAKVIWTLHDYKLLCPRYDCLLHDNEPCDACYTDKRQCLRHKCLKGSLLASYIGYKEARKWTREELSSFTDKFICPSQFMADNMIKGGFAEHKIYPLCNFIDVSQCQRSDFSKKNYFCYFGRLSHEKGIKTLIEAANELKYPLMVIGDGPLRQELESQSESHITFVGRKDWDELKTLVGQARFSVIPSEWYENNPLSVIESQCLGTPVLGSRIGGIPELIETGVNGMSFAPKSTLDLKEKIQMMWAMRFNDKEIAQLAQNHYNSEHYYDNLLHIYQQNHL